MAEDLFGQEIITNPLLRDKFIEPTFTVLDTKQGGWQNRKKQWIRIGIKSEEKREVIKGNVIGGKSAIYRNNGSGNIRDGQKTNNNSSIFDPALCEVIYHWFVPKNGTILDPFAGGSVRGIVANYMGYKYTGIELRSEQVESNIKQSLKILDNNNQPNWHIGDSNDVLNELDKEFDFVFSCPPYMDLEVYSDLPNDLSTMNDEDFTKVYESIINKTCKLLKSGGMACFVVGDVRDKQGYYKDFITITKLAFYKAGLKLYNEAILLNQLGTSMMRCDLLMRNKKLVKVHQNILIFKKP